MGRGGGGGRRLRHHHLLLLLLLLTSLLRLPGQLEQLRGGRAGVEAGPEEGGAGGTGWADRRGQRAGSEVLREHP